MARIRYLKPEFFTDEDLAELPFEARLLFAGLWCHADKSGRLEYRPKYLKAMIFPYDKVDIDKLLKLLSSKPFIARYEYDGKELIEIPTWNEHQKPHHTEKESIFPPAPPLKIKGMEKGMENQLEASTELRDGEVTVKRRLQDNIVSDFETFWKAYPKRIGKGAALKAWKKDGRPTLDVILKAIEDQKQSDQWTKDGGQFIPLPSTWLNQARWDDEPFKQESEMDRWMREHS